MKLLKTYEVQADIFDKILYDLSTHTEYVEDLRPYSYGYQNRNTIYYNKDYLICKECVLDYYCDCIPDSTSWKQVKLRRVLNANAIVQETITGNYAWNFMIRLLHKYYSDDEIYFILNQHTAEYDKGLAQFHYDIPLEVGELVKCDNCFKYDVNGAHCDAIVQMFPRAHDEFLGMYNKRKEKGKEIYKQLFNFFVGELCPKGFRTTYNWIVQRTTKKLFEAIDTTGGSLIYANTDGFVVQTPSTELEHSTKLFEFKEEYKGDVYIYRSKNYLLYQFGDEKKGSCRCSVRPDIDLRIGQVVEYDITKEIIGYDPNGRARTTDKLINIEKKKVYIDEETYCQKNMDN